MSSMKFDPTPLILVAALGVGVGWWFLRKKSTTISTAQLPAGAVATIPQQPQTDPWAPLLNSVGSKLGSWLGTNQPTQATTIPGVPDQIAANPAPGVAEFINGLF